jgi:hypothetical protein
MCREDGISNTSCDLWIVTTSFWMLSAIRHADSSAKFACASQPAVIGRREEQCRELVKWVIILTVFMYVIKPTESGGRKLYLIIIENKRLW